MVEKQFWVVQEQLHRYGLGESISMLCCSSRTKEFKKIGRISYAPLEEFAVGLSSLPRKSYRDLSTHDTIVLFNMYLKNTSLQEADLLMDRFNYMDMKLINRQNEQYRRLSRRICQGDTESMENEIAGAGLSEVKQTQLRNQLRKALSFKEALEMRHTR